MWCRVLYRCLLGFGPYSSVNQEEERNLEVKCPLMSTKWICQKRHLIDQLIYTEKAGRTWEVHYLFETVDVTLVNHCCSTKMFHSWPQRIKAVSKDSQVVSGDHLPSETQNDYKCSLRARSMAHSPFFQMRKLILIQTLWLVKDRAQIRCQLAKRTS